MPIIITSENIAYRLVTEKIELIPRIMSTSIHINKSIFVLLRFRELFFFITLSVPYNIAYDKDNYQTVLW